MTYSLQKSSKKGPERDEKGRYFYAKKHKNDIGTALGIFFTTLAQNLGSFIGIKKCHFFRNNEDDSVIYSHDTPLPPQKEALTFYWIGHSTCYLHLPGGITLLTDPIDDKICKGLYPRKTLPGCRIEDLPKVDICLISHNHLDHFNKPALQKLLSKQPFLIVPEGLGTLSRALGFEKVIELNWWDKVTFTFDDILIDIQATPANHWSIDHKSSFLGFIIASNTFDGNIYYAGDTARLSKEHENALRDEFDIRWRFHPAGPDEVRKVQQTTHQSSADGLLVHFDLILRQLFKKHNASKELFLNAAADAKTLFIHMKTFRLSCIYYDDADRSVKRVLDALKGKNPPLKWYEKQVVEEISLLLKEMQFQDGSTLTPKEAADLLEKQVILPKIGSKTSLKSKA